MRLRLAQKRPNDGRDGEQGPSGARGRDGVSIVGLTGKQGLVGEPGEPGEMGLNGWSPILAVIRDGERRVLEVIDWAGGEGEKPQAKWYIGPTGPTLKLSDAADIRGEQGKAGRNGTMVAATIQEVFIGAPASNPAHQALIFEQIAVDGQAVYQMMVNVP